MRASISSKAHAPQQVVVRAVERVALAPANDVAVHPAPGPLPHPVGHKVRGGSARKRVFDAVVASAALLVLAPVMVIIWLAVRLTSRGPGLHWSKRAGRHQKVFWMPKFRTMSHDAPQAARETLPNASAHLTPLGPFLRRWSMDELPQLACIVCGDMSFIGPRPLLPTDPAQVARASFPAALAVRPGLSGLAQIRGRNLVSPRRKARLDALYARSRSGQFDLEIFARTAAVLLTGQGFI